MGHPVPTWDTLYLRRTLCTFMGHPLPSWETMYLRGTPCTFVGQPVPSWDTFYLRDETPCTFAGHPVTSWDTLYLCGTPCTINKVEYIFHGKVKFIHLQRLKVEQCWFYTDFFPQFKLVFSVWFLAKKCVYVLTICKIFGVVPPPTRPKIIDDNEN